MLLNCLKSWSQINNVDSLYRGLNIEDTAVVNIPIKYIKKANIKLIERNYLIEVNHEKDSIIAFQNRYIHIADSINDVILTDNINIRNINRNIEYSLSKEKKKNKILQIGVGSVVIGTIIAILVK